MSEFKPHDYFCTSEKPYVSRQVFQEHVQTNYDNARDLNDVTKDLQTQTEELHGEMRDYHLELDDVIEGGIVQIKIDERVEQKYNDLSEEYNTELNSLTAQLAQTKSEKFHNSLNLHKDRKPYITIIDDDTRRQVLTELKPLAEQYDIPITVACITGHVGVNPASLTLEELRELEAIGFEVVSHTHNHLRLAEIPLDEAEYELSESRKWLDDNGFNGRKTLVYPFGSRNAEVIKRVRKHYESAFEVDNGSSNAIIPPLNTYSLERITFNTGTGVNQVQRAKDKIDQAFDKNGYVVLMTHVHFEGFSRTDLAEVIEYALAKGLEFVTVAEGLKQFSNVVDIANEFGEFIIDADGKGVPQQEITNAETMLSFGINTPLSDYPTGYSTLVMYTSHPNIDGYPEAGIIETYQRSDAYNYQKLTGYTSKETYQRFWRSGVWTPFEKSSNSGQGTSQTVTLENGWSGNLFYSKNKEGQVWLRGQLTAGVSTKRTTIGSLPNGFGGGLFSPTFNVFNATKENITKDVFYLHGDRRIILYEDAVISEGDTVRISYIYQTIEV